MNRFNNFRKEMNEIATKYFKDKSLSVQSKYPYILANRNNWHDNIILQSTWEYIESYKKISESKSIPFPLHKYIHHGLSSQAFIFNLLGPLLVDNDIHSFRKLFFEHQELISEQTIMQFEYCDRNVFNEKQQQPTSFDFAFLNKGKKSILIESKLVEPNFGGCSVIENGDCDGQNPCSNHDLCYLSQIGRTYWDLMEKYNADESYRNDKICPLSIYYQFYREVLFSKEKNAEFYLLYDERNPAFVRDEKRGLYSILYKNLPNELKQITHKISIQNIIKRLEASNIPWMIEFKKKYGL
jgi:hypothetical protein